MAVDDILRKIKADAEDAARQIVAASQKEADEITAAARAEVEGERERRRARARQRADEERNRIITLARLSGRRGILDEKQRLIDAVFLQTRERVLEMGREEYRQFMRVLLADAAEAGDAEVIVDVNEKRIDQTFLDEVSGELGMGALTLSDERRAIGGGFILKRGRTETNCALDTILRDARERLETDVAAILFGSGDGE